MSFRKYCAKCVYNELTPNISFDEMGVCNYCKQVDSLTERYGTGTQKGYAKLEEIIGNIKADGINKKYDCVIGVSGGTDSSFLLDWAINNKLRPLAVHYDNTWNSSFATLNIAKITGALGIDLYTHVVNNKEIDDIYRAFLLAGVPEFDACTDVAFARVLRDACAKYNIKYIIEGHSFIAEGISPQSNNYFDGRYIKSVHNRYGTADISSYPNLTLSFFLKSIFVDGPKFIRPFWYINYDKLDARKLLVKKYNWTYYGGHHLENYASSFLHKIYNPKKFGIDNRDWSLAADVRAGRIDRNEAVKELQSAIPEDLDLMRYVLQRLKIDKSTWETVILPGKNRHYSEFETYLSTFKRLRFVFYIAMKLGRVPESFYLKYCC